MSERMGGVYVPKPDAFTPEEEIALTLVLADKHGALMFGMLKAIARTVLSAGYRPPSPDTKEK
jgi:hypothetical protein